MIEQVDMDVVGLDERHRAIEAAENGEVAAERRYSERPAVVDHHRDHIAADVQRVGHVEPEAREAAIMTTDLAPIHEHVGAQRRAVELEIGALPLRQGGYRQRPAIPSGAPVIAAAPIAIASVETVGKRNGRPVAHVDGVALAVGDAPPMKAPPRIQECFDAHSPARGSRPHQTERHRRGGHEAKLRQRQSRAELGRLVIERH